MANDFVTVDRASRFGNLIIQIADRLRSVREDVIEAEEKMSHMRADDGSASTPITVSFGITPQTSAAGEAVYDVITDALAALNDPAIITLIERIG